ncbi:MAG: glycosyltransferase family 4 protein [Deltaproteobacteria bacterium]|jgi:glycosyltransferase involved in cell wall biosynthesis|nr:glycosyltransferase family 4 protein [Deltaproteobacteria bacterium]
MHIVLLGNSARGAVNFWSVLMEGLRAADCRVTVFAPGGEAEADAAILARGAALCHYPLDRKGLNPVRDMGTLAALYRLFRREKPDLLFCYTIKPAIYGCLAARCAGVRRRFAAITGLGYMFEADSAVKKVLAVFAALLYRMALHGAAAVFFQNREDRDFFAGAGIVSPAHRVELTRGTGVDVAHFAPAPLPPGPPVFLLVGRLLEAKGLHEYAEAARTLKKRHPAVRFQLLGPPEQGLGAVPPERVRDWEREGIIEYLGQTGDVRPYLAAASVIVLPSWREGTPCSVMEGMSMGRPAVVTDAPGCREVVVNGVNGYLAPPRDSLALAGAMERFILHPEDIAAMGAASRRIAVEEFDARKVAAHIMGVMGL